MSGHTSGESGTLCSGFWPTKRTCRAATPRAAQICFTSPSVSSYPTTAIAAPAQILVAVYWQGRQARREVSIVIDRMNLFPINALQTSVSGSWQTRHCRSGLAFMRKSAPLRSFASDISSFTQNPHFLIANPPIPETYPDGFRRAVAMSSERESPRLLEGRTPPFGRVGIPAAQLLSCHEFLAHGGITDFPSDKGPDYNRSAVLREKLVPCNYLPTE